MGSPQNSGKIVQIGSVAISHGEPKKGAGHRDHTLVISLELVEPGCQRPVVLQPCEGVFHQVPIAVKPSIQLRVAFHGITLSRNHHLGTLLFYLLPDFLAVIALIRDDCFCRWELGNQTGGLGAIVDLPSGDFKLDGQTMSVHR